MKRSHHADPDEHRRAAMLGDQDQRLDRGLPCRRVVLGFRQLGDVVRGVAKRDELAATGQGDRVVEGARRASLGSMCSLDETSATQVDAGSHADPDAERNDDDEEARYRKIPTVSCRYHDRANS